MVWVATQVKRRRGTTAENDAFTGAEGEITVDTEKHELRVHDGVTQGGFKIGGGSGSGRNIGDIFYTTRTDTALAGAVECNGGTYSTADYTGVGSIGELLASGKLDYISLTDYATAISTKGWCDKIGWDGTGTTSFRVPTLTPRIIQTNNIPVVGNGTALGLTNGTQHGALGIESSFLWQGFQNQEGADIGTTLTGSGSLTPGKAMGISTDPTKSGMITDLSETANLRVMVQLATGATDQALETCTSVLADVAGLKTDTAGMIDYVVEKQDPTSANGYTWYRKYKSGWIEQGGKITATSVADGSGSSGNNSINLPVIMADTHYHINLQAQVGSSGWDYANGVILVSRSTTTLTVKVVSGDGSFPLFWQVSGLIAA